MVGAIVSPWGPFILVVMHGLDTVLHGTEHLHDAYGDRFYVHQGMKKLVEEGDLGAKSGGVGFFKEGEPNVPGDADPPDDLAELWMLKSFVEACLVLEEGGCPTREIGLGVMAG